MAEQDTITRTYEFKLRMNRAFKEACEQTLDQARFVYNCALEHRIARYLYAGQSVGLCEQSRQPTEARKELPEVCAGLRNIQQDALERLDEAFKGFFRRLRAGEVPGFPRFKARERYHTFSQKLEPQRACPLKGDKLTVPGVGTVRVRLSRSIEGRVKQLRITRRADGWYVLLVCQIEKPEPLPPTGETVGIDVGIRSFATLSNGETIDNPRHLAKAEEQLKREQRRLSKKRKGSQHRKKARQRVALRHLTVSRGRKDFHHQEARKIVNRFDTIRIEDLNIRGMVRNSKLAKAISDVAWAQFFALLKRKAENAGREFERVNPRYSSQDCSRCGHRQKMPLALRTFVCAECGLVCDRDLNAAHNINRAGPARIAKTPVESDGARRNRNKRGKRLAVTIS